MNRFLAMIMIRFVRRTTETSLQFEAHAHAFAVARTTAILLGTFGVCHSQPLFDAHFIAYPVAGDASFLEPIDLNGDPYPDFIVIGTGFQVAAQLSAVYGTSDGEFETLASQVLDITPDDIELIDVDADGDLDLVMVEFRSSVVQVMLQTETGVFRASDPITTVGAPRKIVAGDLNLDGLEDLVVRPYWSRNLGVHLALAGGGFAPVKKLPFEEYYGLPFEIKDITGDGKPDLVFALRSSLEIWPGNGVGGFGTPIRASGSSTRDFAIEDLNADGLLDIAALGARTFRVLLAKPGTQFVLHAEYETAVYTSNSIALTSGDLNQDGYPDVLVSNRQTHRMLHFAGNGDGTFEERQSLIASSREAVVMDVNADGSPDVILPDGDLIVLPGNGDGTFVRQQSIALRNGGRGFGHTIGDLDQDGDLDVVAVDASRRVSVLLGQGDGTLSLGEDLDVGFPAYAVKLGDVDADGIPDLIVGVEAYPGGVVSVHLGVGDATFGDAITTEAAGSISRIRTTDLNNDGLLDVVVSTRDDWNGTGGMSVLLGDGTGAFPQRSDYGLGAAQDLVVGDFDHDGKEDVVLVTSYGVLRTYAGIGDGSFEPGRVQWPQGGAWAIATADLNGDGNLDLAVGTGLYSSKGSIDIFLGTEEGLFEPHQNLPFKDPLALAIADLDGDGFEDIAAGSYSSRAVTVFFGDGSGTFADYMAYGAVASPKQLSIADMDGDNAPDLVTSNLFENSITVLLSNRDVITHVLLSDLIATPQDGGISLEWRVSTEQWSDLLTIRVARAPDRNGPFEPVSVDLQPRSRMSFLDEMPRADSPWYRLEAVMANGVLSLTGPVYAASSTEPRDGFLSFSTTPGSVRIRYALSKPGKVALNVYDVRGRLVQTLAGGIHSAGTYSLDWNRINRSGTVIPRGVYIVHLRAPGIRQSRKVVLLQP